MSTSPEVQNVQKSKYVIKDGPSLSKDEEEEEDEDNDDGKEKKSIEPQTSSTTSIVEERKDKENERSKIQKKVTIVETELEGNHNYIPDEETTDNNEDIGEIEELDHNTLNILEKYKNPEFKALMGKTSNDFLLPKPVSNKLFSMLIFGFMVSSIFWMIGSTFLNTSTTSFAAMSVLVGVSGVLILFNYYFNIKPKYVTLTETWRQEDVWVEEKLSQLLTTLNCIGATNYYNFGFLIIVFLTLMFTLPVIGLQGNLGNQLSLISPAAKAMFSLMIISCVGAIICLILWMGSLLVFVNKSQNLMIKYLSHIIGALQYQQNQRLQQVITSRQVANVQIQKKKIKVLLQEM